VPGSFINQYRLGEKIGVDGTGEVYRAEDTKLKRQVAINVISEELARDEDLMERFEREARILASLNHPNVAAIYDLSESEGRRTFVLELTEKKQGSG
jgi:serine/threonine-protein kinase